MATAKRPGGLYFIGETAVDADGVAIKGAPKKTKDTDPSKQPGAVGAPTPEERMGIAIASALQGKSPKRAAPDDEAGADGDDGEEVSEQLPTLADLPDHLAGLVTVDEVKALQKTDERVGAVKMYEARLAELEEK